MQDVDTSMTRVHTVDSHAEVQMQVARFRRDGYPDDQIFVLTYDKSRTKRIAEKTDAEQIGISEEGLGTAIANLFRSAGDELQAKMKSLGISDGEAIRLEQEMENDRIVVIAWGGREYFDDEFDKSVFYYPYSHFTSFPFNQHK